MKRRDLDGKKFGRLRVVGYSHTELRKAHWRCRCECGTELVVQANNLLSGHTRSCGCLRKWSPGYDKNGKRIRLYSIWSAMKDRCYNPKNCRYIYYGGKGVSVCREWLEFINFHEWAMANGYNDDLTIDRIDPEGGYKPTNCRWIPMSQQFLNKNLGPNRGVSWDKRKRRWRARVTLRGKEVFNKYFDDHKQAVRAARKAREYYFKEVING